MRIYAIETHWNGTINYVIGECPNKLTAYLKAIREYKWFKVNPDINKIKVIN